MSVRFLRVLTRACSPVRGFHARASADGVNTSRTPYPLIFCFVDTSGKNKFWQELNPDFFESTPNYYKETKFYAQTEAGGGTVQDYDNQGSGSWGSDFNNGVFLSAPRATQVALLSFVAAAWCVSVAYVPLRMLLCKFRLILETHRHHYACC